MTVNVTAVPNTGTRRRSHSIIPNQGDDYVLSGGSLSYNGTRLTVGGGEATISNGDVVYAVSWGDTSFAPSTAGSVYLDVQDPDLTDGRATASLVGPDTAAPSAPRLELGSVDVSAGTTATVNRSPTQSFQSVNTDQVRHTQTGQFALPERDEITTGPIDRTADPAADSKTVTIDGVDEEFWVPDIPKTIAHEFVIRIPDGDHSNINMYIPPFTIADQVGVDDDGNGGREGASQVPWIIGNNTTPTNLKFKSCIVTGTQGAIAPIIEGMNFVGVTPTDDEDTSVNIFGCQNVSFRHISFVGSSASRGFLPYSSTVTIRGGCDFGSNDLQYGIETKHNANVNIDDYDGTVTGTVTDYVIYNMDGSIVSHRNCGATGGMGFITPNSEGMVYNGDHRELEPVVGARMFMSSEQTVSSSGTGSDKIEFTETNYDRGDNFDATNNKFIIPFTGRYQLDLKVQFIAPTSGTELRVGFEELTGPKTLTTTRNSADATNPTISVSDTRELSEGDEIAFKAGHSEGSDLNINNGGTLTHGEITRIN